VDQRRGLQRVIAALGAHEAARQPLQLALDQLDHLVGRRPVAGAGVPQQIGERGRTRATQGS
jgi:hypothetical protein